MPTVRVELLDSKITIGQKKQLAKSLTDIVFETLGYPKGRVLIIFRQTPKSDIARGGKLGR
ncbi:MAG TPA: tautomerase family protein [Candidatus Angelobacter sp.]|nr:tautomerase family protein [Candidatus Angelobacter sp.]